MKKKHELESRWYQEIISTAIVKAVLFSRERWCRWMSKMTGKLRIEAQKVVFCGIGAVLSIYYSWTILAPFSRDTQVIPEVGKVVEVEADIDPAGGIHSRNWEEVDSAVVEFHRYRDSVKAVGGNSWIQFKEQYKIR
ncbi:hypothetical protein [Chitinophaga barathri]|uniref:Uncharacterized protein n=1 Tax=Chitinophaga barathri TaxID=1647451 RepID=A0A3N4MVC2_9BACT|nr:hypothetical protein [Chitinophaga barathri]RPD39343.1 hypothetical protein EG028_19655 [Chitinophaga barathri]